VPEFPLQIGTKSWVRVIRMSVCRLLFFSKIWVKAAPYLCWLQFNVNATTNRSRNIDKRVE
jgi:hypothetical protein